MNLELNLFKNNFFPNISHLMVAPQCISLCINIPSKHAARERQYNFNSYPSIQIFTHPQIFNMYIVRVLIYDFSDLSWHILLPHQATIISQSRTKIRTHPPYEHQLVLFHWHPHLHIDARHGVMINIYSYCFSATCVMTIMCKRKYESPSRRAKNFSSLT